MKNIDIVGFLSKKGIQPIKTKGIQSSFLSPLRDEKAPSFFVNLNKNRWYDFGLGEGGDIISLIQKMLNVDFKEAMQVLSGEKYLPFQPKPAQIKKNESSFRIEKVSNTIRFYGLMSYLHTRGINHNLVVGIPNLVEVIFVAESGKTIFALGFKNDKGGYEIRNKFTKISTSPKAISKIPGDSSILNVYEGFMDFLSALQYCKTSKLKGTTIVLNGVGQKDSLFKLLNEYKKINLFLDNDNAGKKLANEVISKVKNVVDYSAIIYPDYKDFNEFLVNRKS